MSDRATLTGTDASQECLAAAVLAEPGEPRLPEIVEAVHVEPPEVMP